ncbi:hypothetical protein PO124_05860 [Bacillus licheniformis]|nr:hypothetical protein [Bacillus licheniformis]
MEHGAVRVDDRTFRHTGKGRKWSAFRSQSAARLKKSSLRCMKRSLLFGAKTGISPSPKIDCQCVHQSADGSLRVKTARCLRSRCMGLYEVRL